MFESSQSLKLPNLGTAKFLVELSNSEITRGAVKLTGLCSVMSNVDEKKAEVQVSNKFQEPIFSISHGYGPQTAIKGMDVKEKLASVQKELFSDLEAINKANKEPGYLLQVFRSKISHGRTLDTTRKQQITKLLDRTVANFHELLVLMNKAEELVEDDVDAKDYLRYIMYSVLTDAK